MSTSQNPILFDLTRQIIGEVERQVLNIRSKGPVVDKASQYVFLPFRFMGLGINELVRPMFNLAIYSTLLFVAVAILFWTSDVPQDMKESIFTLCIFIALFLVVFAVPSTFSFDTITGSQISALADYIYNLGFDTEAKLDTLGNSLSLVAERTYARTKTFQSVVALIWGLYLYGLNQFTNIALKFVPEHGTKIIGENIVALALYGVVSFLCLVVILGYKRANDAVFRRLSFSVEDLKYRIAQVPTQPILSAGLRDKAAASLRVLAG